MGYLSVVTLLLISPYYANIGQVASYVLMNNVPCAAYDKVVQTDRQGRYHPADVKLKRCDGDTGSSILKCAPNKKDMRKFDLVVVEIASNKVLFLPMVNHTTCQGVCRNGPETCKSNQIFIPETCKCLCNGGGYCLRRQYWDANDCKCKCKEMPISCGSLKTWDESTCSCQCKASAHSPLCRGTIDSLTCECIEKDVYAGITSDDFF